MMPTTPPKGRPTPKRATVRPWRDAHRLVMALAAADWGVLRPNRYKGARMVLTQLAGALKSRPRAVDAGGDLVLTVAEVAELAGYGTRWTSDALGVLDGLGVIRWTRGAVIDGRPVPSRFVINRAELGRLVAEARPGHDAAVRARRAETAAKLAKLGARYLNPGRYRRRSEHVESDSTLSPLTGGVTHTPPGRTRRAVDENGLTLDESARLAVRSKSEPATPASLDNRGSARDVARALAADAHRRSRAGTLFATGVRS